MSICRDCKVPIAWARRGAGWRPMNLDQTPHECARRGADHAASAPIRGARYVQSCGQCAVPPWEPCACSKLLEPEAVA